MEKRKGEYNLVHWTASVWLLRTSFLYKTYYNAVEDSPSFFRYLSLFPSFEEDGILFPPLTYTHTHKRTNAHTHTHSISHTRKHNIFLLHSLTHSLFSISLTQQFQVPLWLVIREGKKCILRSFAKNDLSKKTSSKANGKWGKVKNEEQTKNGEKMWRENILCL